MSKPVGPIRPFISSTFKDFQEERGYLNNTIFPLLNKECYSIGTYFAPVELRWGITQAQSDTGQVLSLCLKNIKECDPYFICLLGDRYGTHRPNERSPLTASHSDFLDDVDWLDASFMNAAKYGHEWVLEDAYQNLSVTELEIQEAVFHREFKHCRFYFREARLKDQEDETEECKLKLSNLKQKVQNHSSPVKFFSTKEELGRKVLADWKDIIKELQPQLQRLPSGAGNEFYYDNFAHEMYAKTRRRGFIETNRTKNLHDKLDRYGLSAIGDQRKPSIFTIVGSTGCGKSAILANWVNLFHTKYHKIKVIAHYVGSSASSTDIISFLRRAKFELSGEHEPGGEHAGASTKDNTDQESIATFRILCSEFETAIINYKKPCVIVVDGIDAFGPTSGLDIEQVRQCSWIPDPIPKHCKFIISTNANPSEKCLRDRKDEIIESATNCIKSREDKMNVITGLLSAHCKKLDPMQLDKVVGAKLSHRPLYLAIVANELRVAATFDNLNKYLDEYVSEATFQGLWTRVIKRWIDDYGRTDGSTTDAMVNREGVNWVADMLRLIACSRQGLTETEIREIQNKKIQYTTPVNGFDFAMLRSATFDALFEWRGGLLNFFHDDLREAVHTLLLVQPGLKKTCHEKIAEYFQEETKPSLRRAEELAFQYKTCEDMHKLLEAISDPQFFSLSSDGNQRFNAVRLRLIRYWDYLVQSGDFSDERIANAYVEKLIQDKKEQDETQSVLVVEEPLKATNMSLEGTLFSVADHHMNTGTQQKEEEPSMPPTNISTECAAPSGELLLESCENLPKEEDHFEVPRLQMETGKLLMDKSCFTQANELFTNAVNKMGKARLMTSGLALLVKIQESLGDLNYYQLNENLVFQYYETALSTLKKIGCNRNDSNYQQLMETKGRILNRLGLSFGLSRTQCGSIERGLEKLKQAEQCMNEANSRAGKVTTKFNIGRLRARRGLRTLKAIKAKMGAGKVTTEYNTRRPKTRDFETGDRYLREALPERERWHGRSHPLVAEVLYERAFVLHEHLKVQNVDACLVREERTKVQELFERALDIRKKIFGDNHPLVATSSYHLGLLLQEYGSQEEKAEAVKLIEEALRIRETKFGPQHRLTQNVRDTIAKLLHSQQSPTQPKRPKNVDEIDGWTRVTHKRSSTSKASQKPTQPHKSKSKKRKNTTTHDHDLQRPSKTQK